MAEKRSAAAPGAANDLLVEIGCEELPPRALDDLREALFAAVCSGLERENLTFDRPASTAFSTPRRLALLLRNTAASQPDLVQQKRGPALANAFDTAGRPTAAANGFASSLGLEVKDLETVKTDKGQWLAAQIRVPGKPLGELIFPVLEQALRQLPIARPMRWADHDYSFIRPVHWVVVMHGSQVIPGQLLGKPAGNATFGHRVHAPGPHRLSAAGDYLQRLREARVLADPSERAAAIRAQLLALDAGTLIDPALLAEVNNLVEWPVAIACSFDEAFLAVPHEALVASMQDHQKFFPVRAAGGAGVSNRFIAIANLDSPQPQRLREGFERVVRPRLADARFFLEQDLKQGLGAFAAGLEGVVFHGKLGSIADKSRRIAALSEKIATKLGFDPAQCKRAAELAKCDLMSQMVGEFPELQGIMGRHYAAHSGEPDGVASAIEQHYWPRFSGDAIPTAPVAQVVGLADRADTLVAIFAAGLRPSGNKDPFALRRAALGMARILLEARLDLPLDRLLVLAANELGAAGIEAAPEVLGEVREFVLERVRFHLRELGFPAGLVNAAMASGWTTLSDLEARLRALEAFVGEESGSGLAAANKRIGNILRKTEDDFSLDIDEDRLLSQHEKDLFLLVRDAETSLEPLLERGDYSSSLAQLAGLRGAVDSFFDAVLVMDEDPVLRRNRLSLLFRLKSLFDRIADLSVLG